LIGARAQHPSLTDDALSRWKRGPLLLQRMKPAEAGLVCWTPPLYTAGTKWPTRQIWSMRIGFPFFKAGRGGQYTPIHGAGSACGLSECWDLRGGPRRGAALCQAVPKQLVIDNAGRIGRRRRPATQADWVWVDAMKAQEAKIAAIGNSYSPLGPKFFTGLSDQMSTSEIII